MPTRHISSEGYCPTEISFRFTVMASQRAVKITQSATARKASTNNATTISVNKPLYQVLNRFCLTQSAIPVRGGEAMASGAAPT